MKRLYYIVPRVVWCLKSQPSSPETCALATPGPDDTLNHPEPAPKRVMHNPSVMSFSVEPLNAETVVIRVGKALDFRNAAEFKAICQEQVQNGVRNFILDFSETGILDSTGLGAIFSLYRQVSPRNGQVVFASVSRPVQVVVQLTRTYKVFRQFPTVEAAQEALQQT